MHSARSWLDSPSILPGWWTLRVNVTLDNWQKNSYLALRMVYTVLGISYLALGMVYLVLNLEF